MSNSSASPSSETAAERDERIHPFRLFDAYERWTALTAFLVALVTYWSTVMPNIGLNDDGEMATAALHFGVMHPSGYPLWTILAGLWSHLIPFGNGSWKINLFSGFCTALSAGAFSLVSLNATRWLGIARTPATFLSSAVTLVFVWVNPVWSHAVVGKGLYALHVCLMMALILVTYVWIRRPHWKNAFVWSVFIFCLGMSNHHMTLAMAFLPLLVILLLHAELFWEYFVYSLIIAALLYLGFAWLSTDQFHALAMKAAVRLLYVVAGAFLLLVLARRKLTEWRRGLLLVAAVFLGLLPYAYMPFASSTNPPMNWGYCSTSEGFFYAINRSQYWGTLADQLQGSVGKLMGVPPLEKPKGPKAPDEETPLQSFAGYCKVFWQVLARNLSPFPILTALAGLALFWRLPREQRIWFYLLVIGFCLSAFLQPLSYNNGYDNAGWDMQYQYQSLGYGFFVMLAGFGLAILYAALRERFPGAGWARTLLSGAAAGAALYTFVVSLPNSSQRGHWFGWMYGHDMLADLPRDSFVFGGTDPGRFVPTYMVFGESFEKSKRDPSFDRRDLYIVTQNALADTFYNRYIRSHYTNERPTIFTWFEKLLGRDRTYPEERLTLPHREDIIAMFDVLMRQYQSNPGAMPNPQTDPVALNSAVAEWIFLHNRDKKYGTPRHFYVEESFPMQWSYPYAIPHGLCYEINHDKLDALPPGTAEKDLAWWDDYIRKLEAVPGFRHDDLAMHSFAKLRNTGGNIYAFRNMNDAAERAYKQALFMWPGNTETTSNLVNLYTRLGRFKDAHDLVVGYLPLDPNSKILQRLASMTEARMKAAEQLPQQMAALQSSPDNRQAIAAVLQGLLVLGRTQEVDAIVSNAVSRTPGDINFLRDMINFYATQGRIPQALEITRVLAKSQPDQWDVPYTIAKYELLSGHREECLSNIALAVKLGGNAAVQQVLREQLFQQLAKDPAFQRALEGNPASRESDANSLLDSIQKAISKQRESTGSSNPPALRSRNSAR
jgi:tetratricopeptide (TPR) repeat protein